MCRIFGYMGPPRAIRDLLVTPPHGLVEQAHHPRELPPGVVGGDGYGFASYGPASGAPACWRSVRPIWEDEELVSTGSRVQSGCVVASVRSATGGSPVTLANTPPYVSGRISLVHNGQLEAFAERWAQRFSNELPPSLRTAMAGRTDSEHLLAMVITLLGDDPSAGALARAAQEVIDRCGAWSRELGREAVLNLIISDGARLVATRSAFGAECPSLYVWRRPGDGQSAFMVASEPTFDDPAWSPVAPGTRLVAERNATTGEWAFAE